MKKKFTIMIFDESRLGEVKTRKISTTFIMFLLVAVVVYIIASSAGFYYLSSLIKENKTLVTYKSENVKLKKQISGFENQLVVINDRLASVNELESQVRGLAVYGKSPESKKKLAVGGKEVDVAEDISEVAARKDKDYFKDLSSSLTSLGTELEKKAQSLSELADFLEGQKLRMGSTPSMWPTNGWISSRYGYRISPFTGRRVFHEGLDVASRVGAPIRATAAGTVIFSGRKNGYGKVVIINHGFGYMTKYAHNSNNLVSVGQKVMKGDRIAQVGNSGRSTGPHVHYEVLVNGVPVNPLKFIVGSK